MQKSVNPNPVRSAIMNEIKRRLKKLKT